MSPAPSALTTGEMARRLKKPLHRIQYVVRTRGISPVSRAGNLQLFTEADLARVGSELRRIESDRSPDRRQEAGQ